MLTAAAEADQHLHDAGELVLRAGGVCVTEAASDAKDVEGGGALHGRALSHREEVVAITARASSVALGDEERDRRGGAFDLIAKGGTGGLRQRGTNER